ncbi:MAG: MFS transporter [Pseudomonadota bacterium]
MPQRSLSLAALLACVFTFGVAFAGIIPWITLVLESRGVSPVTIGVVSGANALGVMIMAPFAGRIVRRFGMANALLAGGFVATCTIGLLPIFDSVPAWIALRLLSGLAGAVPWIATETWINMIAGDSVRARVIALYAVALALGFSVGPIVLTATGTEGLLPVVTFLLISLASMLPVLVVRRHAPELEAEEGSDVWKALIAMPTVMIAVFVAGSVDTAFFAFLPIWGTRIGLEQGPALMLLSMFVAGNIVLQFPIGWLADRIGARKIMALSGLICLLAPLPALAAAGSMVALGAVLFVWGGAAWSLYSLALVEIGHRLSGSALAAANGAIVLVYTISNITGPPAAGGSMQIWNPHGFLFVSSAAAAVLLVVLLLRRRGGARPRI